jgi:alkylation response protein AidB-like acyl-CoA dehydrogenase
VRVSLTEDQEDLRAGLRDVLADRCTPDVVRAAMLSDTGADLDLYRVLAEFGVTDLPGFVEVGIVLEECGSALVPAPVVSAVGICGPALAAASGDGEPDELLVALREGSAVPVLALDGEGSLEDGRVRGVLPLVPEAHVATHLVLPVVDGDALSLVAVDAADASITVATTMDATRRLCSVTLDGPPARVVGHRDAAPDALGAAQLFGAVALAAELVGVAQATLDAAVGHAKLREQFGRPIGSYQAVSHRCADMFVALESARSHASYAAWAVEYGSDQAELAASQAKAGASEAAVFCAQSNIQIHGGIGFTWEHDAHLYLKRARSGAALLGTASAHRRRIADLMGV